MPALFLIPRSHPDTHPINRLETHALLSDRATVRIMWRAAARLVYYNIILCNKGLYDVLALQLTHFRNVCEELRDNVGFYLLYPLFTDLDVIHNDFFSNLCQIYVSLQTQMSFISFLSVS